ncbi:MAG TPA: DUF1501 domain-containing protein [Planctomycetaceae bacterium]|nr:DUF1501 domain-containing protein [Planctomycetaceae bacterium]
MSSLSRRSWLQASACGFGALAAHALAARTNGAVAATPRHLAHHPPRAQRIIFLFMQGGPSQVDTFDHKPLLARRDGEQMPFDDSRVIANTGQRGTPQRVMQSPWTFRQHGDSGRWVSDLFPQTARHVDDLCFLHGMQTEGVAHGPATLFLHCGSTNQVRPSFGSWVTYGLGTENENLPAFVTLAPSAGNGGPRNYGAAFLPARYQGTALGRAGSPASQATLRNLGPYDGDLARQRRQLDLIQALNAEQLAAAPSNSAFDALVDSYELAWRMQTQVPDVLNLAGETAATQSAYGLDHPATEQFGRLCLMARRLCEAGTRFIQVTYGDNTANPAWDQHSNLSKHADHARACDQPIAALLADLGQRGLLDDTLVWWGAEFGRTPYAEKNGTGRDHNPQGFTTWLAGGGVKPGFAYGATDEFGHRAVDGKIHMHDLHATLLDLLGLDHERLTFRHAGRDFRLTDVHGRVIDAIVD